MKLLIAGTRTLYPTFADIDRSLNDLRNSSPVAIILMPPIERVISGCAAGVDNVGERWANARLPRVGDRDPIDRFPADWQKHGTRAGPIRNRAMGEACDAALIFWNGVSTGTANMIGILEKLGKPRVVVTWSGR